MTVNDGKKASYEWDLRQAAIEATNDPLLGCLLLLAQYYERPSSARALLSHLPISHQKLTPSLFIRAAQRIGLSAQLSQVPLTKISDLSLPAVLLLNDHQACILLQIDKKVKIIMPENGEGITEITFEQLNKRYTGYTLFVKPEYVFSDRSSETLGESNKNWFWSAMSAVLPLYTEALVASALINCFALAIPLFVMNVYDRVVPNEAIETLWVLVAGILIVFFFDFLLRTLRNYFIDTAGKKVDIQLSAVIFEQILGIKMAVRPSSVGAFANTVQSFEIFRDFITSTSITVLVDLPFVVLYIFVIYLVSGPLFWVPLLMMPLVILVSVFLQWPLTKLTKESYQHAAEKQATLIESLGGAEVIKTLSAEGTMQRRWEQVVALAAGLGIKLRFVSTLGINFSIFAQQLASVLVIIVGVYLIAQNKMTTGALIAATILTSRALAPMSQVAGLLNRYYQSVNALQSLNRVMQLPIERPLHKRTLHRPVLRGNIEFLNVKFKYPNSELYAIDNINLKIKSGEKIGILGRLGSGKSTIAKLLIGLYYPAEGNILIDGTEYQQIDPADLRHNIGYVPQDITLFYGSVKSNIMLGTIGMDDESMLAAAKMAGVDDFIRRHPQGYDLLINERGSNLSRGQRQSIVIARAILLNPPILIFDEPSNSMDDHNEALLKKNLRSLLTPDKTLILITHKPSMLDLVDRLIILDNGKIVADGPKEQVLTALSHSNITIKKL